LTLVLGSVMCLALVLAQAARADGVAVKKRLEARFPGVQVTGVAAAPFPGLYEVLVGDGLFYTDEEVKYILNGSLIDAASQRNLTEERLSKLRGIPFDQLPLGSAIKLVKGNGSRKLAIFEDPDCPFCRRLEQELARVDNVTIYVLLYPLEELHPGATARSIRIWCSGDRAKAWTDAVLGKATPNASADCKHPLESLKKFAEERRIFATPTMVFENGTRVAGAIPAADIEKKLAENR
jgi:thiol:disulfide interchange protein DsbC